MDQSASGTAQTKRQVNKTCAVPGGLGTWFELPPTVETVGYHLPRPRRSRLARAQGDRKTEREKLKQALAIFTELKMPRECDEVREELEKVAGG